MPRRWKSIRCFKGNDADEYLSEWLGRQLYPQVGSPLVVLGTEHCTKTKVELVMKGELGRSSFVVKNTEGEDCFIVERKSLLRWSRRIISDKVGKPICYVERKHGMECYMQVWSLEDAKPCLVMEIVESKSRNKRDELIAVIQGDKVDNRRFLRLGGNLRNRIFGVSWTKDVKVHGNQVAVTWKMLGHHSDGAETLDPRYVMELPAGVDAAAIVALAVCLEEKECGDCPNTPDPLESHVDKPINAFGEDFIAKRTDMYLLAKKSDHLSVVNSAGHEILTCEDNGQFMSLSDTPVFQMTKGAFKAQGSDFTNNPIEVSFLESRGDHSFFRLALQVSSSSPKGCRVGLIAAMNRHDHVIRIELADKISKKSFKRGAGLCIDTPRPILARAVLGNQSAEVFENWYYDTVDNFFGTAFQNDQEISHVGIGVEIATGVDIAMIFAAILVIIKFLPASFACRVVSGTVQPRGVNPVRIAGHNENNHDKSVVTLIGNCIVDCSNGDFLLASHKQIRDHGDPLNGGM